jgi:superfamily I DNA/RNA helicase
VLLRTAALAAPVAKALRDHGIPFEITGERPWWEGEPIKSLLERLRESPPGEAPATAIRELWEKMDAEGTLKMPGKGSKPRGEAGGLGPGELRERLLALAALYGDTGELLDTLAVSGPEDGRLGAPVKREGVRIMTIHASKGLEFDHVFVIGLEEGLLPFTLYEGKDAPAERIEEEQRLLYVAMTRARQGLYLSWARSRTLGNRKLQAPPSRFLEKLEELIPLVREVPERPGEIQPGLF